MKILRENMSIVLLEFRKASVLILPIVFHVFPVLAGVFIITRTCSFWVWLT